MASKSCYLFFSTNERPKSDSAAFIISWAGNAAVDSGVIPLGEILRMNAQKYQEMYLVWLQELAFLSQDTSHAPEYLSTQDFQPVWTKIATQYSFGQSSVANDVIRLWALSDWLIEHGIEKLTSSGMPAYLVRTLERWCSDRGVQFGHEKTTRERKPHLSAVKAFVYLALHLAQYGFQKRPKRSHTQLVLVDYLIGEIFDSSSSSSYRSIYWEDAVDLIELSSHSVRWIHIDIFGGIGLGVRRRLKGTKRLNRLTSQNVSHEVLQSWMSIPLAFRTWLRYRRARQYATQNFARNWRHQSSGLDLWPVVEGALEQEMDGIAGVKSVLFQELFNAAFDFDQTGTSCLYLMENQDWELALLQARHKHGGVRNFGYVHVCIRPWDFRYSSQALMQGVPGLVPSGVLATNSHDVNCLRQNGFITPNIIELEPTRFAQARQGVVWENSHELELETLPVRLLILGEYDTTASQMLLDLALTTRRETCWITSIEFRPHPANAIPGRSLDTGVEVRRDGSLQEALDRSDAVLCSNMTSAAIQACLSGKVPLMWFWDRVLDGNVLPANLYIPVRSVEEFASGLMKVACSNQSASGVDPLGFFHDEAFPRWKNFLRSTAG